MRRMTWFLFVFFAALCLLSFSFAGSGAAQDSGFSGYTDEYGSGLTSDEFIDSIAAICEDYGIGRSIHNVFQGMDTEEFMTIYDTFGGERNPYFSVTIDRYPDPDAAREAFGPILEMERNYNNMTAAITQVIADSPDVIGSYMQTDGIEASNLRYYRLYGDCLVTLVVLDEKDFEQAMGILSSIDAAANGEKYVSYDLEDSETEPVYEAFDREDLPEQGDWYAAHTYTVLGHEIVCMTDIDDYIYEEDGKLIFDYASLAEGLGWRWTAWRQEDEAVYTADGEILLKSEDGKYYPAAKHVYMLDDEFSADARWYVWFWYPNNGIFERIEYAFGTGKSYIDFTRTDLLSRSMEGNRTYYLNNTQDGTVNRDMAIIACYLLENISQESDRDPLDAVYGKPGPYQE